MSRDLIHRTALPATVEEVFALRTSERWVTLKADELGDGSLLVHRSVRADGGVDLAVSRELPAGVPAFLERFLPKEGRAVQHESWGPAGADGSCHGTWSVDMPGAPARLGGTSSLAPAADGSLQVILGSATVSIPLIGGRAETFIVEMTMKLMSKEAELMVASLSG
jgi:hypothetical protein